ncbi:hypothetical protein PIB30_020816 [Stylosanthes scabra]|uniref:Uncharacterized protein n=1 Tax=Stylosanthes scabra TaxID=79078 RepID=A0ABU6TAC6_9FABA|nr:hypothetical protein [Stylosanthes scabra]
MRWEQRNNRTELRNQNINLGHAPWDGDKHRRGNGEEQRGGDDNDPSSNNKHRGCSDNKVAAVDSGERKQGLVVTGPERPTFQGLSFDARQIFGRAELYGLACPELVGGHVGSSKDRFGCIGCLESSWKGNVSSI